MANIRQSILIRTDLTFPVGLLAAQVAHIHIEHARQVLIPGLEPVSTDNTYMDWIADPYLYIHGVPNREVLMHYMTEAKRQDIAIAQWRDTVNVQISDTQRPAFADILIGGALGPADSDAIRVILGDLPLL